MTGSILITGAGGQVGHELSIAASPHRLEPLTRQQLDITDRNQISLAFVRHRPDILINAAAYTQVDRAKYESELAYAINRDGVANLADACEAAKIPLLHLSTDYVFDGCKQGAYIESDPIAPLGVYGASKAAGETALRESLRRHFILRTSWVFSSTGDNFVKTMLRLGCERDELEIVDDQRGCPTSARSIAMVLLEIADRFLGGEEMEWGSFHYCNRPATTWFEFAAKIFRQAGGYGNLKLKPIPSSKFPTSARRPLNSVLDCSRLEQKYAVRQENWADELGLVLNQLK